jgi:hypothetical protein
MSGVVGELFNDEFSQIGTNCLQLFDAEFLQVVGTVYFL